MPLNPRGLSGSNSFFVHCQLPCTCLLEHGRPLQTVSEVLPSMCTQYNSLRRNSYKPLSSRLRPRSKWKQTYKTPSRGVADSCLCQTPSKDKSLTNTSSELTINVNFCCQTGEKTTEQPASLGNLRLNSLNIVVSS